MATYAPNQSFMNNRTDSRQRSENQQKEGPVAKVIERQTAKIPSDVFMWAAFAAMAGSAFLQFKRRKNQSLFVGEWVPTLLIFGLYNKLVKQMGSDRFGHSMGRDGGGEGRSSMSTQEIANPI